MRCIIYFSINLLCLHSDCTCKQRVPCKRLRQKISVCVSRYFVSLNLKLFFYSRGKLSKRYSKSGKDFSITSHVGELLDYLRYSPNHRRERALALVRNQDDHRPVPVSFRRQRSYGEVGDLIELYNICAGKTQSQIIANDSVRLPTDIQQNRKIPYKI